MGRMSGKIACTSSNFCWHNAYHYYLPYIPSRHEIERSNVLELLSLLRYVPGDAQKVGRATFQKDGPSTHAYTKLCSSKVARSFNSSTFTKGTCKRSYYARGMAGIISRCLSAYWHKVA